MDHITLIYFIVGFSVVFVFSINYFNHPGYKFVEEDKPLSSADNDILLEPALPKYLTDRFEYNFYLAAYVVVTEVIYMMLVLFLPDLISEGDKTESHLIVVTQGNIVMAALLITGIAPNLPYIRKLLEYSKLYLHEKAQIPGKGQAVYRQVRDYTPCYSDNVISEILTDERFSVKDVENSRVNRPDLTADDFLLDKWTIAGRWAKLSYLMHFVDLWSKKIPFSGYMGNRELQYDSINKSYIVLQPLIADYKSGSISAENDARLSTRLDATLHRAYRLVSCLLYLAAKTDAAVDSYLDELGYASNERKDFPIPWNTVIVMIGAVVLSIVVGSLLTILISWFGIVGVNGDIETEEIISWTFYGIPFIAIPVIAVLCVKRYLSTRSESWPLVTETETYNRYEDRPWHIYFLVALFAYLIGATVLYILAITAKTLETEAIHYISMLKVVLAWSSVVFITAGYTAFRLDSARIPSHSAYKHYLIRSLGALSQGIATSAVVYFVYIHAKGLPLNLVLTKPNDWGKIFVLCLIGFLLGVSINVATGFGRLRQRRCQGRRPVSREILLDIDQNKMGAKTINISQQGALVQSDEIMNTTYIGDVLTLSNKAGEKANAKIIDIRRDRIHLLFEDVSEWLALQAKLGIPVIA